MTWVTGCRLALGLALLPACDPAPDVTYVALGAAPDSLKLDRGTYHSTDSRVIAILDVEDTSASGCSGVAVFGCPGSEVSIDDTLVTFEALAAGDAAIRGKTDKGKDVSIDFTVEVVTALQVREVTRLGAGSDERQVDVRADQELSMASDGGVTLQVNLLGKSRVSLGYIEEFTALSADESLLTVEYGRYSTGYRLNLTPVAVGTTTLLVTTPSTSLEVPIRIEE